MLLSIFTKTPVYVILKQLLMLVSAGLHFYKNSELNPKNYIPHLVSNPNVSKSFYCVCFMLQELSIRNFAIIDDLQIRFSTGLTILSGETPRANNLEAWEGLFRGI